MYDKRYKVLVVEDEVDIQQVICFFLKESGFDAQGIAGGREAIELIATSQPDLVILDIMMYPVSGWEVLHWLHTQQLTPLLPIIVLTALVHVTDQLQGFEEGAVEYVTKPTEPSVIVECVRELLALSAEQRILLQRTRLDEQRKMLERIRALQADEYVHEQGQWL